MNDYYGIIIEDLRIFIYTNDIYELLENIQKLREKFKFKKNAYLYFFDNNNELEKSIKIHVPSWSSGITIDNNILIVNASYWKKKNHLSIDETIIHEFIHVVINNICKFECPLWLNEGLAQYYSNEHIKFVEFKKHLPDNLDMYLLDYNNDLLYYLSAKVVSYLIETFGESLVIDKIKTVKNFENDELLGRDSINKYINSKKLY